MRSTVCNARVVNLRPHFCSFGPSRQGDCRRDYMLQAEHESLQDDCRRNMRPARASASGTTGGTCVPPLRLQAGLQAEHASRQGECRRDYMRNMRPTRATAGGTTCGTCVPPGRLQAGLQAEHASRQGDCRQDLKFN